MSWKSRRCFCTAETKHADTKAETLQSRRQRWWKDVTSPFYHCSSIMLRIVRKRAGCWTDTGNPPPPSEHSSRDIRGENFIIQSTMLLHFASRRAHRRTVPRSEGSFVTTLGHKGMLDRWWTQGDSHTDTHAHAHTHALTHAHSDWKVSPCLFSAQR